MKNPFKYGGIVSQDAFCNRKKEIAYLLKAMENGEKLFVHSERRMGKTSLIKLTLRKLPREHYLSVFIDLWPTDGEISFVTTTAKAITESMSTTTERLLEIARKFFSRLTPSITVNDEGRPRVTFGLQRLSEPDHEVEEVLQVPAKIASQGEKDVVIVFDEFQQILEYDNDF